ncbi:MAG: ATP synthase F1 subunit epsilon [Planctomycetia bacterium]|nr:ATP synthase F1 subunit epsilon [Planctomycetia bacterium]
MEMKCIVVTPERTILDKPATFVSLPLFDGEIGIAWNHSPLIGRLGTGELCIKNEQQSESYFISQGFVEVYQNVITLLTGHAIPASEITQDSADAARHAAEIKPKNSLVEVELRNAALLKAQAMQRIVKKGKK